MKKHLLPVLQAGVTIYILARLFGDEELRANAVRVVSEADWRWLAGAVVAAAASELESEYGVYTRCGLHCAPVAHKTLGSFPKGAVRFSFGAFNTEEQIDRAVKAVRSVAQGLRGR